MTDATADATATPSGLNIHLLDMGTEKYGDCLLVQLGARTILIDGAHAADWQGHDGMKSIPDQLGSLLGASPFTVDLLVVTHCHADHIGCLPTLIANGTLKATAALVADERLGFGRASMEAAATGTGKADAFAAAMREEDHSELSDAALEAFLEDAATLEQRYIAMLQKLSADGTMLLRYGRDDHSKIETAFKDFGLKVLGPTRPHLAICADAIAQFNSSASAAAAGDVSLASWYRAMFAASDDEEYVQDRPGKGAALNNQSIVLKLQVGLASVLLAGDMQFAMPEIVKLGPLMPALRAAVKAAGPYTFIKLTHHSSYNGMDDSVLAEWSATRSFAHTGGSNDAGHPASGVLQLLEKHTNDIHWARTDHNGLIGVTFSRGAAKLDIEKGKLNDPTPNGDALEIALVTPVSAPPAPVGSAIETAGSAGISEVSFSAKLDPTVSKLTVTFDIQRVPSAASSTPGPVKSSVLPPPQPMPIAVTLPDQPQLRTPLVQLHPDTLVYDLPTDRDLPNLLFVTNSSRLANNLGSQEASALLNAITKRGKALYDVQDLNNPYPEVRSQLAKKYDGVVILGGYDVLPVMRFDVLPPSLRQQLGPNTSDADNFIVWSDAAYGDVDGDLQADLPVSRLPDARSPRLVAAALASKKAPGPASRFGLRNARRPFAEGPNKEISGTAPMSVCIPCGPAQAGLAGAAMNYIMMHGSDFDATRYWGEDAGGTVEGMNLSNIPETFAGVVFMGCCWGALTVTGIASQTPQGQTPAVRTPNASLALAWLHAGAQAYIGCTGSHYSPTLAPFDYFGGPLHQAFWERYNSGQAPAEALY